jgi:hypothetical protein
MTLPWHPDALIERERAQNARTWEALGRLGVSEGTELSLSFVYETGGARADRELAAFLRSAGYEIAVEPDGVTGRTEPMALSLAAIDAWVKRMLHAGYEHGGALFAGWTATVSRDVRQADASHRLPDEAAVSTR